MPDKRALFTRPIAECGYGEFVDDARRNLARLRARYKRNADGTLMGNDQSMRNICMQRRDKRHQIRMNESRGERAVHEEKAASA